MSTDSRTGSAEDRAWQQLQATLAGRPVPSIVVAIGLGDGALLRMLETRAPGRAVLALEPNPRAAAALLAGRDWPRWQASGRLTYLVAPEYAGQGDAWRAFPADPEDHVVLLDPDVARSVTPEALAAARALKRILFGARANAEARRRFAPRYLLNALHNVPALIGGRDLAELAGTYTDRAGVIVAAGPSLDQAIGDLQVLQRRALVIAVDTALRPLLAAGIAPHLAVGLDPGEANARHFRALPDAPRTWMVSETALDPAAARLFAGRTLWFRVADHDPWPWLRTQGIDVHRLDVWGSVVTAAFQVALLAGCNPIAFVGADLSYAGPQPYARGTTYELDWARWAAAGLSLSDVWGTFHGGASASAAGLEGARRPTTPALLAFRDWLVSRAHASGRHIVNASGAGLLFGGGIDARPLADLLRDGSEVPDVSDVLGTGQARSLDEAWKARLLGVADQAERGVSSPLLQQWTAFSAGGWNAGAVGAALRAAAAGARRDMPARAALPYDVLARLPEAIGRWRRVLSAEGPVGPGWVTRADTLLDEALTILERLRESGPHPFEHPAPLAGVQGHDEPLSAAATGDDRSRWLVALHEGLMGAAAAGAPPDSAFFSGAVRPRDPDPGGDEARLPAEADALSIRAMLDWVRCAATRHHAARALPAISVARAIAAAVAAAGSAGSERVSLTVHLQASSGTRLTLRTSADVRRLARIDTGLLAPEGAQQSRTLARTYLVTPSSLTGTLLPDPAGPSAGALDLGVRVLPRVLTDGALPRASIAYTVDAGALCVGPYTTTSFVVHEDGSASQGREWPQPILNELPDGRGGWIAWNNGMRHWDRPADAYVLARPAGSADVTRVDLPFRPGWGVWHGGRVHWTCFKTGLGSWAPDAPPAITLEALALMAVFADEHGLLLQPVLRDGDGLALRRRAASAWRWTGGVLTDVPLGRSGQWTAREQSRDGWIATAFPEADRVRLETPDGRALLLSCHHPFKIAWLGRSLLVSTIQGELLLFERIAA